MRTVDINLASNPFRNDKPIWAVLGLFGALALGFTGYNAWAYLTAGSRQAQLEQEIAGHRKRMHEMKAEADALQAALAKVDEETLSSQAEFVSSILDQRNFSWTHLFNALETTTPWDVKLLSIRPQFEVINRRTGEGRFRIQVSGIGRTFDSFLDLQESLQGAELFSEVTPEEYERQGDDRVDFNMAFTYTPPKVEPGESTTADGSSAIAGKEEELPGWPTESDETGSADESGPADAAAVDADSAPASPGPGVPPPADRGAAQAAAGVQGQPAAIDPGANPVVALPAGPAAVPAESAAADELRENEIRQPNKRRLDPNRNPGAGRRKRPPAAAPSEPPAGADR